VGGAAVFLICVGGALGGAFGDVQNHSVRQLFIFLFLFLTGLIWGVFFVIYIGDPPCETSQKKKKKLFGTSAEHPRAAFIDDAQGALGGCFGDV